MNDYPRQSPYNHLRLGEVRPSGWMLQQMRDDLRGGFAGHLDVLSPRVSSKAFSEGRVRSFEKTPSGMVHDTPRTWWNGESEAVWLDGFVRMAYLAGEQNAMRKADQWLRALLSSQDESGYIGIYTEDCRYQHRKENGEFWTQSRAFIVMLAYYEITGSKEYLDAVERALALTMAHYGPHRSYFNNEEPAGGTGHGLMLVDVLEWLFRLTGKEQYRNYGIWCYDDYCSASDIRDKDNHLARLLSQEEGFHWHAPHVTEHLRVPLWVSSVSNEQYYRVAARNAYSKIQRYLVPSGACIGDENIGDRQPTADMSYEYCAITELLTSLQSACQKMGEALWGDMAEWLTFNAAQGARAPDGTAISYLTKDNRDVASSEMHGGRLKLSPTHEDVAVCCNPNAVKLLPYYTSRMWLHLADNKGVCAFCYGPSELHTTINGTDVAIWEETDYPFSEQITFHISPEVPLFFELRLRIPGWASSYDLEAHGADVHDDGEFCRIRKEWKKDERISVFFHCTIETVRVCNGEFAVRRGPLLYALPIPEVRSVLRTYDVAGVTDYAAIPAEPTQPLLISHQCADFRLQHNPEGNRLQPWHKSPISLAGYLLSRKGLKHSVILLPLGSTLLRQTTFSEYKTAQ
ncbi:MAG: beta-L-arabinofuranosidase domain-containing protein [Verrucomicrobiota bacterium]